MKDYASMSDREINMHVASIIYPESTVIESRSRPPCAFVTGSVPDCWVDYCNNPEDAWPIILQNRISVIFDSSDESEESDEWVKACVGGEEYFISYHYCHRALRAAMVVFLMMKEGEK